MNPQRHARILALAAVFQAARLVQELARRGHTDETAFGALALSVLTLEAASTEAVYGGASGLRLGLETLRDRLSGRTTNDDLELARYVLSMLRLERRLRGHGPMLEALRAGIEGIHEQEQPRPGTEGAVRPAVVGRLAELYQQTLSTLTPRIIVNGEHGYLANPRIADQVRTALFGGIRSAFLWHQTGGRRWQLIFGRARLVADAEQALRELDEPAGGATLH